jgi:uncharacterized protein (DUF58 family)
MTRIFFVVFWAVACAAMTIAALQTGAWFYWLWAGLAAFFFLINALVALGARAARLEEEEEAERRNHGGNDT